MFPEVTAQHMIPILPAPGNTTEQTFSMLITQNGTLSNFVGKFDSNYFKQRESEFTFLLF